jgi:hypothetical protein
MAETPGPKWGQGGAYYQDAHGLHKLSNDGNNPVMTKWNGATAQPSQPGSENTPIIIAGIILILVVAGFLIYEYKIRKGKKI